MRSTGLRCIGAALGALVVACALPASSFADLPNALAQSAAPVEQAAKPVVDAVQQAAPVANSANEAAAPVAQAAQPVATAPAAATKPVTEAVARSTRPVAQRVAAAVAQAATPAVSSAQRAAEPVVRNAAGTVEPVVKSVARTAEPVVKSVAGTTRRAVEPVVAGTTKPVLDTVERSAKPVGSPRHATEPAGEASARSIVPDRFGASTAPAIDPVTGPAEPAIAPAGGRSVRPVVADGAARPEGRDSSTQANRSALATGLAPVAALDRNRAGAAPADDRMRPTGGSEAVQPPASGPTGIAVAGGGSATGGSSSTFLFLGLAALTALAIPGVLRRLRVASDPWRPTPFALILERPG